MSPTHGTLERADRSFLDTNILVYLDDRSEPIKKRRSEELVAGLIAMRSCVISLQVLQEYFNAATRRLGLDAEFARRKVETYSRFQVVELSSSDLLAAIDLHRLHRISFWDALILRAAIQAGCRTLYTEDMQHDRTIDGVRIVNPFL